MRKHLSIRVTGRVQGVSYRASTLEKARQLGVCGWVANLPDGSVRVEAEGPEAVVDELVQWLHEGPPAARVETLESEAHALEGWSQFEIR